MKKLEVIVLLLIAGLVVIGNIQLIQYKKAKEVVQTNQGVHASEAEHIEESPTIVEVVEDIVEDIIPTPEPLNILLVGLDKSKYLADINIIVHLDTENNKLKLVSMPRDMFIDFREPQFSSIRDNNSKLSIYYCKLTEVYSYAGGKDKGLETMRQVASSITGLEIDHVASVDTGGFVEIVDILGGVEFDVPQDMFYEDPFQDLYIDLKAGVQHLDGDKAEQLVRFRKYTGPTPPDMQRMKVQQEFLQVLSKKMLEIDNIGTVTKLMKTSYDIVKTDMDILSMIQYAEYVLGEDVGELLASKDMIIIPSVSERMGELNAWYEKWDPTEAKSVVAELMEE